MLWNNGLDAVAVERDQYQRDPVGAIDVDLLRATVSIGGGRRCLLVMSMWRG